MVGLSTNLFSTLGFDHGATDELTIFRTNSKQCAILGLRCDVSHVIYEHSPQRLPVASSSVECFDDPEIQRQSTPLPAGIMPAVPPATVSPHLPDKTKSIVRAYSGVDAV